MPLDRQLPAAIFPKAPVRAMDLNYLLNQIIFGHHCAVLGTSNSGKSALLNSLTSRAAIELMDDEHSTGDTNDRRHLPVFVDCLEAGNSEHALYEVIMRRLTDEFARVQGLSLPEQQDRYNEPEILNAIHEKILASTDELAFRSAFASGLRQLLQKTHYRVLLILDEFDDLFCSLPPWPFRQLRAAANQHAGRIQFVVATSRLLGSLRNDDESYEFRELFQMYTRVLLPLSNLDALSLLTYLDEQKSTRSDKKRNDVIVSVAGGHPGLLERVHGIFGELSADSRWSADLTAILGRLVQWRSISTECGRLWNELEEAERDAIRQLLSQSNLAITASERPASNLVELPREAKQILNRKGLLAKAGGGILFSPLFEYYLRQSLPTHSSGDEFAVSGLVCDSETGQIWADGQEITWDLASEHQRSLVRLLCASAGSVCTYDEIADHVYGVGEGVTPGAIRELVNRTRKKLPSPDYILNVPGEGYRIKS